MLRRSILIPVLLLAIQLFANDRPAYLEVPDQNPLQILTPSLQNQKQTKMRLANGLEAILISDPDSNQSGAAISFEAGSWDDPEEYPGMAHFCEHMVFMGSKAYPDENGFFTCIGNKGGSLNAYTASDRTVYMFSVTNEGFEESIDQFAHFFIDPLFLASGITRELHAVDQENDKNIENDHWRSWMILKETGNPLHPNHFFSTGNAKTLGNIPREALIKWFNKTYSPHKAHLIVYANLPLDQLKELVSETFNQIPQRGCSKGYPETSIFSKQQKGSLLVIEPIRDLRNLTLLFEIPKEYQEDKTHTAQLAAYVLGSENEGGLADQLKRRKWATQVVVGTDNLAKNRSLFSIEIDLTEEGIHAYEQVLQTTFACITQLKQQGIPSYLFEEQKQMNELSYAYQSRGDVFSILSHHAHHMIDENLETYPYHLTLASKYDSKKMDQFLASLSQKESVVLLTAKVELSGIHPDQKEKWLGGKYKFLTTHIASLPQASTLETPYQIPSSNPFIPTNLTASTVQEDKIPQTQLVTQNEKGLCYYIYDTKFQTPSVAWKIAIRSPLLNSSPKALLLQSLLIQITNEKVSKHSDYANKAGLYASLSEGDNRLLLSLSGYEEKAPLFLDCLIFQMKAGATEEEFQREKERLYRHLTNQLKAIPYQQTQRLAATILFDDVHLVEDLITTLETLSFEEYQYFHKEVFQTTYLEGMFAGPHSKEHIKELWAHLQEVFPSNPYTKEKHLSRHFLTLPQGGPFKIEANSAMQGHVALLCLQQGPATFQKRASQALLGKAIRYDFFKTLRTKQQVGYIAVSKASEEDDQLYQIFLVQSTTHRSEELIPRFELFLETYVKDFQNHITKERFEELKSMHLHALRMPPENLQALAEESYTLAFDKEGDFTYKDKLITAVENLTYAQFQQDVIQFLARQNTKRLAILFSGQAPSKEKDFQYQQTTAEHLRQHGAYLTQKDQE